MHIVSEVLKSVWIVPKLSSIFLKIHHCIRHTKLKVYNLIRESKFSSIISINNFLICQTLIGHKIDKIESRVTYQTILKFL